MSQVPPAPKDPSRRAWLTAFLRPVQAAAGAQPDPAPKVSPGTPQAFVAVIAARHCLAYQGTFCTTCSERCPYPGSIVIDGGFPRVVPSVCTGCRVCHDVCPAPTNAVLMIPKTGS